MKRSILTLAVFISAVLIALGQEKLDYNNRVIVIGGGGSRGAWGAGFAKHLVTKFGPYRYAFGTSTGSLIAPLLVLNDFEKLEKAYTSVSQKDIFNVNPFKEKNGNLKGLKAVWRFVWGKQTLGESKNLRKLIDRFISDGEYHTITTPANKLLFAVSVVDMNSGAMKIVYSRDVPDAKEMKNWIWASANEPLFMSYYNVKPAAYVDGGVRENVPLLAALEFAQQNKIYDIDVIVNKPENPLINTEFKKRNILGGLNRLIDIWSMEVRENDILLAELKAIADACGQQVASLKGEQMYSIHVHYLPSDMFKGLYQKELLFNKERMKEFWNAGVAGKEDQPKLLPLKISIPESILIQFKNARQRLPAPIM